MTTTKTIPAERLRGFDVHQGDTLHILAVMDSAFRVQFSRNEPASSEPRGKASEWLRTAKGSVQLAPDKHGAICYGVGQQRVWNQSPGTGSVECDALVGNAIGESKLRA